MNKMYYPVVALALGHLVTDMQAGALPIVLPQLKELFSLSYSQLAAIVLLQNIMSSVIQPAFGYLTDRRSLPRFCRFVRRWQVQALPLWAGFPAIRCFYARLFLSAWRALPITRRLLKQSIF